MLLIGQVGMKESAQSTADSKDTDLHRTLQGEEPPAAELPTFALGVPPAAWVAQSCGS